MNHNDMETPSEGLFAFLKGEKSLDDPDVPGTEARLGSILQRSAREMRTDPGFRADLEARLVEAARRSAHSQQAGFSLQGGLQRVIRSLSAAGRGLVVAGLALALVLVLGWAVRELIPRPPLPAGDPPQPVEIQPSPIPDPSEAPKSPAVEESSVEEQETTAEPADQGQVLAGGQLIELEADFPPAPAARPVYRRLPGEPVTPQTARQMAEQLGLDGAVYHYPSESGDPNYVVSDGHSRVMFLGTTDRFYYIADYTSILADTTEALPFEQQLAAAEEWLSARGLLNFPYQAEPLPGFAGTVRFIQLLDGYPLRHELFEAPQIDIEVSPQGQVLGVQYTRLRFEPETALPLLTAEQAWELALAFQDGLGVSLAAREPEPYTLNTWIREYPAGETVDLWGYAESLAPAEAGAPPLVTFQNYLLVGDVQAFAAQAIPGEYMHIWGQFREAGGGRVFHLAGWESAPETGDSYTGVIRRDGGRALLQKEDGQALLLPGLPVEIPGGQQVRVSGVILDAPEPVLEWNVAQSGDPGRGAGSWTGGISGVTLEPRSFSATPTPIYPYQVGQRIEAMTGTILGQIEEDAFGSQSLKVHFSAGPAEGFPSGLYSQLSGPDLADLSAFHLLPVRLWGTIASLSGELPEIEVERYEPVYPDLKVQAWLGTWEVVTLEGSQVVLFTAQDGQQYVTASSIELEVDQMTGLPGDPVILEGLVYPGETFGGYPVLTEFASQVAGDLTSLDDYEIQSGKPTVMFTEQAGWKAMPAGNLAVEKIELIYHTFDMSHGSLPSPDAPPTYLQPVWRFTGHYESGTEFEILVQALPEEYWLK